MLIEDSTQSPDPNRAEPLIVFAQFKFGYTSFGIGAGILGVFGNGNVQLVNALH